MNWSFVAHDNNACDTQLAGCFGAVPYAYSIGTYEVTKSQYAEFLNAKAASDPLGLWNAGMAGDGIIRSGVSGSFTYTVAPSQVNVPVRVVSFYDALRFTNWMNNGQGAGDTETGAYTLLGGTAVPSNGTSITRNSGATIVLTSEDEWYKAAYYNSVSSIYYDYPAGSDTPSTCTTPTATPNSANCDAALPAPAPRGSYPGSPSPYGTFDQGGNLFEWNEALINDIQRGFRGGAYSNVVTNLSAASRRAGDPSQEVNTIGFRLALIPEPGTGLLVVVGLLGLALRRAKH